MVPLRMQAEEVRGIVVIVIEKQTFSFMNPTRNQFNPPELSNPTAMKLKRSLLVQSGYTDYSWQRLTTLTDGSVFDSITNKHK